LHNTSLLDVREAKVESQIWEKPDLKRLAACGVVMAAWGKEVWLKKCISILS
jgi:hypothetical protein